MINIFRILLFVFSIQIGFSQSQKDTKSKKLFSLGKQTYTVNDFKYYLLKNSNLPDADSAEFKIREYLDLYINFRLKVQEAQQLGHDKTEKFLKEFDGYKQELAKPFLVNTNLMESLVKEAYNRKQQEVSASHILIGLSPDASSEKEKEVYDQLLSIKQRAIEGEAFEELAKQYSDDKGAYLGYFTVFNLVYPFETAAYNLPIGEISDPVRTKFGYHLIQVHNRRPARGEILTAHIMIRYAQDSVSMASAENKAFTIYENLNNGADWKQQCELYTQDPGSRNNEGRIKWFTTGGLVPEYEDAAFSLTEIGSYTKPVRTQFGWHIIKLLDKKQNLPFESLKKDLSTKVKRDSRSHGTKNQTIAELKQLLKFELDSATKSLAFKAIDSTILQGNWKQPIKTQDTLKQLFKVNNRKVTIGEFWNYTATQHTRGSSLNEHLDRLYNHFEEKILLEEEIINLERSNYEYSMLLDEYRSGILIFDLMDEHVWKKALANEQGLIDFYNRNKSNYEKDEYAKVIRYTSKSESVLDSVILFSSHSKDELLSLFNSKPLSLEIVEETVFKGNNDFIDKHWEVGYHRETLENGYFVLWKVINLSKGDYHELNENRGLVISDYQKELEKNWLDKLKGKYPVKIKNATLKSLIASFE